MSAAATCSRCGHPLVEGGGFCTACGAPRGAGPACSRCGAALVEAARFCTRCGAPRAEAGAVQQALPTRLQAKLKQATAEAHKILEAASKGELEEKDLRSELFGVGLVVEEEEAWLLDLDNGRWVRYDGVELQPVEAAAES